MPHETVTERFALVAVTFVGSSGANWGSGHPDATPLVVTVVYTAVPLPAAFTAVTLKVNLVPLVRSMTVQVSAVEVAALVHPAAGENPVIGQKTSTLYPVMAEPPSLSGGVQVRLTVESPGLPVREADGPGFEAGTEGDADGDSAITSPRVTGEAVDAPLPSTAPPPEAPPHPATSMAAHPRTAMPARSLTMPALPALLRTSTMRPFLSGHVPAA